MFVGRVIQCFTTLFDQRQKELKKIEKELQEAEAVEGKEKSRKMVFQFCFPQFISPKSCVPKHTSLRHIAL